MKDEGSVGSQRGGGSLLVTPIPRVPVWGLVNVYVIACIWVRRKGEKGREGGVGYEEEATKGKSEKMEEIENGESGKRANETLGR